MNSKLFIIGQLIAKRQEKKLKDKGATVPPNFSNRHAITMAAGNNPGLSVLSLNDEASMIESQVSPSNTSSNTESTDNTNAVLDQHAKQIEGLKKDADSTQTVLGEHTSQLEGLKKDMASLQQAKLPEIKPLQDDIEALKKQMPSLESLREEINLLKEKASEIDSLKKDNEELKELLANSINIPELVSELQKQLKSLKGEFTKLKKLVQSLIKPN